MLPSANMYELEAAVYADNIPALLDALIACSRDTMAETPGWVTKKSRELLVELLLNTPVNDIRPAERHRWRCQRNIIHALRHEYVSDVIAQQVAIPEQIADTEEYLRKRRLNDLDSVIRATEYLQERREYLNAIGDSIGSACDAVSRMLLDVGDLGASPEAVRESYDLVGFGSEDSFYISHNASILRDLNVDASWRLSLKGNFEQALLGSRYERLRLPDRHASPEKAIPKICPPFEFRTTSNSSVAPSRSFERPSDQLEFAASSGNYLAIVDGLHFYNRAGGLAPAWLLIATRSSIVALWRRKPEPGRLSNPLTQCAQFLLDCERYMYISGKASTRKLLSMTLAWAHDQAGSNTRQIASELRASGLLYSDSLDAAIRQTLLDLKGTPLEAGFQRAKRAFQRIRKAPELLAQHWVPSDEVAKELGLPALSRMQKVGTKYPPSL
jgi:hypothetical protein